MASPRAKVLIVDDHPITRMGMRVLIDKQANFSVCAEAADAEEALRLIAQHEPELATVDISLGRTNGIELTKRIGAVSPKVRVLVVSMHNELVYAQRALRAGAMGYLMKQEASEYLITALSCIVRGEVYLSTNAAQRLVRTMSHPNGEALPTDSLSDREMEVYQLIGSGYGTRQIATTLGLSTKTVDSYREHLKVKLHLDSGSELLYHAIQWCRHEQDR